jgi:tetratricopeptide (TPR) repeat protein
MKRFFLLLTILAAFTLSVKAADVDSLKQQLQYTLTDSAKADLYLKMAQAYLDQKAPNRVYKARNSENAVNYTMLALHLYSKMEDTTGLRKSYASLGKAYRAGRKFTQAKWFMIQSTVIAKNQKDIPNMVAGLVELANIKIEAGDYVTAKKDLNYAQRLSANYKVDGYQEDIIQGLAMAENGIKNMPEEEAVVTTVSNTGSSTIIIENAAVKSNTKVPVKSHKLKAKTLKTNTIARKTIKPVVSDKLASL